MWTYIYTDNNKDEVVFVCDAETITEADKKYQEEIGTHPMKQPYIGCQIKY